MAARLFLFCFCTFLLFTSREPPWADAHVVYDTTESLVDRGRLDTTLTAGPTSFYTVRNGRRYGVFPLGNVIALVPSYLAYKALHQMPWLHGQRLFPDRPLYAMICHLSSAAMMALVCVLFFEMAQRRGASARLATALSLACAFGTFIFVYARSPYAEALQTVALTWLIERTLREAEQPTTAGLGWLGVAGGLLINSKLIYVLVLPVVALYLVFETHRCGQLGRLLRRSFLGFFVFAELVALALWHNHLKTGSYLDSGYHYAEGVFSGDLFAALYGFLLSTGKGIFLYAPPLVFGAIGLPTALSRRRKETIFLLSVVTVVLLFNAKFRAWHADYCWGPRYLTPIIPIVLLFAVPWLPKALARGRLCLRRGLVAALCGAGLTVQLLGASLYWDHYIRALIAVKDQTGAAGWFQDSLSQGHYIPVFSPLRGHAWLLAHLIRNDPHLDADAPWKAIVPQPADLSESWSRLRLDWWPLEWLSAKADPKEAPPLYATAVTLALLGTATVLSGEALRRSLQPRAGIPNRSLSVLFDE